MSPWQVALMGKHPASHDYLALGPGRTRLASVFSWIRAGFTVPVLMALAARRTPVMWRFWMLPEKARSWICGVFASSRDRSGRPHPLLVAGLGTPPPTDGDWGTLSGACRQTWADIAAVIGDDRLTTRGIVSALDRLPPPMNATRPRPLDSVQKALMLEQAGRLLSACRTSRQVGIQLENRPEEHWNLFLEWQRVLSELTPVAPYSLFYCETAGYFEMFYRPLNRSDGARLMDIALTPSC